jgi:hypothetical protein
MALLKAGVAGSGSASVGTGASQNAANAAARYGGGSGPGGWHPDVLYMLGLVIFEVFIVGWLSHHLLKG